MTVGPEAAGSESTNHPAAAIVRASVQKRNKKKNNAGIRGLEEVQVPAKKGK